MRSHKIDDGLQFDLSVRRFNRLIVDLIDKSIVAEHAQIDTAPFLKLRAVPFAQSVDHEALIAVDRDPFMRIELGQNRFDGQPVDFRQTAIRLLAAPSVTLRVEPESGPG